MKYDDEPIYAWSKFNWAFWNPVQCIGEKVYFGFYYEDEVGNRQTPLQYEIKKSIGCYK